MNQFMKILVAIVFGLYGLNGIQASGTLLEREISYTCSDCLSGGRRQPSFFQPLHQLPANACFCSQPERSCSLAVVCLQDFVVQNLPACWDRPESSVPSHSVSNCFSLYKEVVFPSVTNRKQACSSFHCVSVSKRGNYFFTEKNHHLICI